MKIYKSAATAAVDSGYGYMLIPWPADRLGPYGARLSTDADMDAYVAETVEDHPVVRIAGICAGKNDHGEPVIQIGVVVRR